MSILPSEPQCFPECLFKPDKHLSHRGPDASTGSAPPEESLAHRNWWVLHTLPRQEKSLARQLLAKSIPFYLPLVTKRLRVRNRAMTSYLPIFPGYVFLLAEPEERLSALTTKRVVRSLQVADQKGLWRDLDQIYRLVHSGKPITPEDRLVPGSLVEIRSGPLTGLRGKILEHATRRRFVVEVDFIHRGASILVDDFTLAPVAD